MFSFGRTARLSSKWLYHFACLPTINENSCCSTALPALGVFSDLYFGHSDMCVVVFHFNLHFHDVILLLNKSGVQLPAIKHRHIAETKVGGGEGLC